MPWFLYQNALGLTPSAWMTNNNPAIIPTPANNRSWRPAQPTARQTARAVPIATASASQVALRGDARTPQQIEAAGGLWSQLFDPRGLRPEVQHHPDAYYDPDTHQAGPGQAPFVSFTRDIGIAKGFAGLAGYIYLTRLNVGVDYNQYRGGNALQAEVMALQGVALRDIIAVRYRSTNQIYLNQAWQQASMTQATFNAAIALLAG